MRKAKRKGWNVHTSRLLSEVLSNPGTSAMLVPLTIFRNLLTAVGERAIQLNDPQLNLLMCRLTLYSVADPECPKYDPKLLKEVERLADKASKM